MNETTVKAPAYGSYAEVLCGPHAGLVGRVRAILPATAGEQPEPPRVRLTVQGGARIVVPAADVRQID
jgi:hypothetical protein